MTELVERFLKLDDQKFSDSLIQVCKDNNINNIVTVAKKGHILFNEILEHNPELWEELKSLSIQVYSDRELSRRDLYQDISNSNILMFDDLIKTGSHVTHVKDSIKDRIKKCVGDNETQFYYYVVYRYENSIIVNKEIENRLFVFDSKPANEYYQFSLDEGIYFQKNLLPSSNDLPLVKGTIASIDDLIDALRKYRDTHVVIDEFKIGNEKFPLINVFFDDFKFPKDDKGLVLSSTLRIRYEKNESGDKYNVLITPFVLTQSMKADTLQSLYYDMYGEMIENVSNHFLMMYRKLVHNFSFYLAEEIVDRFEDSGYRFYLNFESMNLYGDEYTNSLILHHLRKSNSDNITGYVGNNVTKNNENYRKELFETLIYEPKKKDYAYNYAFCPIENLFSLFKMNERSVISMLYCYLENYSISNELEYNKETNTIERGFYGGESSLCYFPVEDRICYRMLNRFYNKCRKNYLVFMENFLLMFDKASHYFFNNNYSDYISYGDFLYFKNYYYNLTEDRLIDELESKEYKLNDIEFDRVYYFEDNWLNYILASDDFTFNKRY
jgi:hypothetical protein